MKQGTDARRLTGRRAVRLAILRTAREVRRAAAAGQPISLRNARRLLQRRLGQVLGRPVREFELPWISQWAFRSGKDDEDAVDDLSRVWEMFGFGGRSNDYFARHKRDWAAIGQTEEANQDSISFHTG